MENIIEEISDFDSKIKDIDEVTGTDIKINPDFYIHFALIRAQQALLSDDIKGAFLKYRLFIEHIEVLCRAANLLTEEYDKTIKEFTDSSEYKDEINGDIRGSKLANKKLLLLMSEVFKGKTIVEPIRA